MVLGIFTFQNLESSRFKTSCFSKVLWRLSKLAVDISYGHEINLKEPKSPRTSSLTASGRQNVLQYARIHSILEWYCHLEARNSSRLWSEAPLLRNLRKLAETAATAEGPRMPQCRGIKSGYCRASCIIEYMYTDIQSQSPDPQLQRKPNPKHQNSDTFYSPKSNPNS